MENIGKLIVGVGLVLVIVGLGFWLFGGRLGWLGHLPGDIRIERPGFTLYAPITTMIILSIVLTLMLSIISRFLR
jgi:hypothetical protein